MNCSHPTDIPILDCCQEDDGDIPLYIVVRIRWLGQKLYDHAAGLTILPYRKFARMTKAVVYSQRAIELGFSNYTYATITDIRTGIESHEGSEPGSNQWDSWYRQSATFTQDGVPTSVLTFINNYFSTATKIETYTWTEENTGQQMQERCWTLLTGRDFSGLSPWNIPGNPELNTNLKLIDWDGNETISNCGFGGETSLENQFSGNQNAAATVIEQYDVEMPWLEWSIFFKLQAVRVLPGEYTRSEYMDATTGTVGSLVASLPVTYAVPTRCDPTQFPSGSLNGSTMRSYIVFIPSAP